MIVIHATLPIDPGHREDATEVFADLARGSRDEAGVVDYRVTSDLEEPNVIRIIEQYEDEAALGAHSETEHFQEFQAAIPEMLGGAPDITRYDVESVSDVEI